MFYGSQPLAKYSSDLERASFFEDNQENSMPRKSSKSGKRKAKTTYRARISSGRVLLRIPGYGLQRLSPGDLVKYISNAKLKVAAKKVLRFKGVRRIKSRRKGSRRQKKAT
jgi:hypothetical protein